MMTRRPLATPLSCGAPTNQKSQPPIFARKPPERGHGLTHERIAEHLEAFRQAGGTIEVLGTTRALTRIGVDAIDAPTPQPANPSPRTRSR